MKQRLSRSMVVLLSSLALACAADVEPDARLTAGAAQQSGAQAKTNPDAQLLVDFKSRVDKYMELRDRLKKDSPPLKETKDASKLQASQDVLAAKIREARKDAQPGEIFTPEIRQLFRRLMYPELKGPEADETKTTIREEKPKGVALKINATYPEDQPVTTMPPNILAALPKLPEDLEYRFVNNHMILRDTHANLIVDFVPNAIR